MDCKKVRLNKINVELSQKDILQQPPKLMNKNINVVESTKSINHTGNYFFIKDPRPTNIRHNTA